MNAFETGCPAPALWLRRASLAAVAAMVFLLFWLGATPVAVNLFPEPWDKLAHFAAYAAMAALLTLGSARSQPLTVFLAVCLIGALDEWHQVYLPGRSSDIADFLTDALAAALTVAVLEALRLRLAAFCAQRVGSQ